MRRSTINIILFMVCLCLPLSAMASSWTGTIQSLSYTQEGDDFSFTWGAEVSQAWAPDAETTESYGCYIGCTAAGRGGYACDDFNFGDMTLHAEAETLLAPLATTEDYGCYSGWTATGTGDYACYSSTYTSFKLSAKSGDDVVVVEWVDGEWVVDGLEPGTMDSISFNLAQGEVTLTTSE